MSLFSALRRIWRRRDEELAERTYQVDSDIRQLDEHGHIMDTGLLGANADGNLASARTADRIADRAIESEDAREHEEPA